MKRKHYVELNRQERRLALNGLNCFRNKLVDMAGLMERAKPVRRLLRHLGRVADICPAIAKGGVSSEADILRRPPFIQRVQPCEMLILGQAYLPVPARKVGDIPFSAEIVLHIVGRAAEIHCLPHIGTVDIVAGRLVVFLVQPNGTGGGFAGLFNDGHIRFGSVRIRFLNIALETGANERFC